MSDNRNTGKPNSEPRSMGDKTRSQRPARGAGFGANTGYRTAAGGRGSFGGGHRPGDGAHHSGEGRPYSPRPAGPRPEGSRPTGDRTGGNRPYSPRPAGPRPEGSRPTGDRTGGNRPYSPRPAGPRPEGSRPTGDRPGGNRPYSPRPAGPRPEGSRPTGDRTGGSRSYSPRPAGPRPGSSNSFHPKGSPVRRPAGPYGKPVPAESTGLTLNARRLALDVLRDVHENGAFAALSLNEHLPNGGLKPEDRRLATGIVYGTLENEIKIDYILDKFMEHPTREPAQRDILRMSAYQILFLDRVPDSAAVNEAVKLARTLDMESATGFINAVLRNLVRGKETLEWPNKEDDPRFWLHIMSSTPLWLVDRLTQAYGAEEAENLLTYRESTHPMVARPNMTKLTDEEFEALLKTKNFTYSKGVAPHAYLLEGVIELGFDPDYQSGRFSIQGQSSMLAAEAVQAKPGMKILDACAAPGGKSAYLCECMEMTGRVFAWELHEKRALLLDGVKRRLKLENLRVSVRDAMDFRDDLVGVMDAVLLDAPCSGTGVMLQKPDIKLRLQESDIQPIVENQGKLLDTLCRYVKPNGVLVYSTCSLLPEENKEQISAFLEKHPDFSVEPLPTSFPVALRQRQDDLGLQLLGYRDGVEGFYIVRLRRMR